jgi:hypothetical protein
MARKRRHRAAKAKLARLIKKQRARLPEHTKRINMTNASTPLPTTINNLISEYEHSIAGVTMYVIEPGLGNQSPILHVDKITGNIVALPADGTRMYVHKSSARTYTYEQIPEVKKLCEHCPSDGTCAAHATVHNNILYIASPNHNIVLMFDMSDSVLTYTGSIQQDKPMGVVVWNDELCILSCDFISGSHLYAYSLDGVFLREVESGYPYATGFVEHDGSLYFNKKGDIIKMSMNEGTYSFTEYSVETTINVENSGICIYGDELFATNFTSGNLLVMDLNTMAFKKTIGSVGFHKPRSVVVLNGVMYVSSYYAREIVVIR